MVHVVLVSIILMVSARSDTSLSLDVEGAGNDFGGLGSSHCSVVPPNFTILVKHDAICEQVGIHVLLVL